MSDSTAAAIKAGARLAVKRSTLAANTTVNIGGAIDMDDEAPLRIVRSRLVRNSSDDTSGAIRSGEGPITIVASRLIGNQAVDDGGAIRLSNNGPVRILRSTISGNRTGDNGGGIQTEGEGSLAIRDLTISGNHATADGGGIALDGSGPFPTTVTNSSLASNRALDFGGGIYAIGGTELRLNAVTIARNHGSADDTGAHAPGGGIFRNTTGTMSVRNSILALNKLGTEPIRNDCGGEVGEPFDSLGNNLLSTLAPSGICNGFDAPGDRVNVNPKLAGLKQNGGPTKTVALKKRSPAINKAHEPSAPNRDQRGVKRKNPDIGAFELR